MAAWDIKQLSWMAGNMLPAGQVVADACKHAEDLSCVAVSWQEQDPRTCLTNSGINTDEDSACVVLEVSR
jgi:type IV pilus assembly protein PilV